MTAEEMLEILYQRTRDKMLRRRAQLAAAAKKSEDKQSHKK